MKKGVFVGSFDPLTLGHCNIISRSLLLCDKIIVGIGNNSEKTYRYSCEKRQQFIEKTFDTKRVIPMIYQGLTIDFCTQIQANFIIRGIRNTNDLEFEKSLAQTNFELSGIETVFLLTDPKLAHISSSLVKDIQHFGGDFSKFVPESVYRMMIKQN